jgi:hypothetical protein
MVGRNMKKFICVAIMITLVLVCTGCSFLFNSDADSDVATPSEASPREEASKPDIIATQDKAIDDVYYAWAIGCSAILASASDGYDAHEFGMFVKNDRNARIARTGILPESWDIHSKDELIATIERMTDGGHSKSFEQTYDLISSLTDLGYEKMLEPMSAAEKDRMALTKTLGDKWGTQRIKAWDWFRMIHLVGWGYIAGYLELQEAYDYMDPIIDRLRGTFSSWNEAADNYMDGFAWWSQTDVSKPGTEYQRRLEVYEAIKDDTSLFDPSVWK